MGSVDGDFARWEAEEMEAAGREAAISEAAGEFLAKIEAVSKLPGDQMPAALRLAGEVLDAATLLSLLRLVAENEDGDYDDLLMPSPDLPSHYDVGDDA